MKIAEICVFYEHSRRGRNSMKIASVLKRLLSSGKLKVFTPFSPSVPEAMNLLQQERILQEVLSITGLESSEVIVEEQLDTIPVAFSDELFVTPNSLEGCEFANQLVIFDQGQLSLEENAPLKMLLPFGSGESGLHAAGYALAFATACRMEVVFYHTTWRRNSVTEEDPALHMCDAARAVLASLEQSARAHGLTTRTIVECADDVVEGLIQCALRENLSIIAMARGKTTGRDGSYVTHALAQSPLPLMICGRLQEVSLWAS